MNIKEKRDESKNLSWYLQASKVSSRSEYDLTNSFITFGQSIYTINLWRQYLKRGEKSRRSKLNHFRNRFTDMTAKKFRT